ncbi:hypothetical protein Hs30E_14690 [Lactococcus hodotermopsidis]|uniref:LysM peptidoglycan-binding domain-containing protein n=1 Tax=Pseudolactococcus hodotermopsidis TaxID=2709157 RepID=A0A6A0BF01_9LACT|nr:LysM peptidoglycan-binding domain-containing protein [Lactococcus hodotermopsidis]GFH42918.1 hypothetical protein Hs30E_14690 [Lactococcus hodotermopsidis]
MGKHDLQQKYGKLVAYKPSKTTSTKIAISAGAFLTTLGFAHAASAESYTVKSGDSLWAISQQYDTTVAELAKINNISDPAVLSIGQKIETSATAVQNATAPQAPAATTPAPAPTPTEIIKEIPAVTYTVKAGDTLGAIADQYDVSVAEIAKNSGIQNQNFIFIGQNLIITPARTEKVASTPETPATPAPKPVELPAVTYTVKAGDTLSTIAISQKVSVADIVKYSNITNPNLIFVNQKLILKPATVVNPDTGDIANTGSAGEASDGYVNVPLDVTVGPYSNGNTYASGNCTWYVKDVFKARMGDWWGNAKDWTASAQREGFVVDDKPVANLTIAVFAPGSAGADKTYGHVAVVVGVSEDTVTVKEMNGTAGLGKTNTRIVPKNSASYIHMDY